MKRHSFCEQAICRHPGSSWSFEQLVSALSRDLPCAAGPFLDVSSPSSCRKLTSSAPSQPSPPTWPRSRSRFTAASTQCWVRVRPLPAHCCACVSRPRTLCTTRQPMRPLLWLTRRLPTPVPHQCFDDHAHSLSEAAVKEGSSMRVQCASFGSSTGSREGGLGSKDVPPSQPPLMRPPGPASSPHPRLPAPVPPSTTRASARPMSCPLRPSTLTLSHDKCRLVFSVQRLPPPPRRLSIPLPRAPVANVSEVSDAETLQEVQAA